MVLASQPRTILFFYLHMHHSPIFHERLAAVRVGNFEFEPVMDRRE